MVSKIAVMALVAVVAVPILLGYGLNMEETTGNRYVPAGDSINAVPLLEEPSAFYYVPADLTAINTQQNKGYPYYNQLTHTRTGLILYETSFTSGSLPGALSIGDGLDSYSFATNAPNVRLTVALQGEYGITHSFGPVSQVYGKSLSNGTIALTAIHADPEYDETFYEANITSFSYSYTDGVNRGGDSYQQYARTGYTADQAATAGYFVDISAGFKLLSGEKIWTLPAYANRVVMTMDLYSGSDFWVDNLSFIRSGDVWEVHLSTDPTVLAELPVYESDNTVYQLTETSGYYQIDYVGKWHKAIGVATSYITYGPINKNSVADWGRIRISQDPENVGWTPSFRFDSVSVRSMEYTVISDKYYTPSIYRANNPITTISGIAKYGDSITFGGQTFTVSNGNIIIDGKQVPLEGRNFNSIQENGIYYNRIGNTVISESYTPSSIRFDGVWAINQIITQNQNLETYNETKWVPGNFAWDGVDTNFKIAGLMTSLGAFIALAVYGRRSGTKVMPLLVVCGGAALMFLVMI